MLLQNNRLNLLRIQWVTNLKIFEYFTGSVSLWVKAKIVDNTIINKYRDRSKFDYPDFVFIQDMNKVFCLIAITNGCFVQQMKIFVHKLYLNTECTFHRFTIVSRTVASLISSQLPNSVPAINSVNSDILTIMNCKEVTNVTNSK